MSLRSAAAQSTGLGAATAVMGCGGTWLATDTTEWWPFCGLAGVTFAIALYLVRATWIYRSGTE
ncbi:hypothetical protein ABZ369_13290 [Streptomyces sp. NPDC005918]|uniref:hypothetical protein n=1 Tax=Streptomyces sp. NPDC005918 TaxID=3155454 RepID=UPI0033DF3BB6